MDSSKVTSHSNKIFYFNSIIVLKCDVKFSIKL